MFEAPVPNRLQLTIADLTPTGVKHPARKHRGMVVTEGSEQNSLAGFTAQIVSAYAAHNQIPAAELPELIGTVAGQLARIGSEPEQLAENTMESCRAGPALGSA